MHVLVREGQKAIGEGRVKSQRQRCRLPFPGVLVSKMEDEDPSLNFKPGIMRGRKGRRRREGGRCSSLGTFTDSRFSSRRLRGTHSGWMRQ